MKDTATDLSISLSMCASTSPEPPKLTVMMVRFGKVSSVHERIFLASAGIVLGRRHATDQPLVAVISRSEARFARTDSVVKGSECLRRLSPDDHSHRRHQGDRGATRRTHQAGKTVLVDPR